jgi:hypothetical protein
MSSGLFFSTVCSKTLSKPTCDFCSVVPRFQKKNGSSNSDSWPHQSRNAARVLLLSTMNFIRVDFPLPALPLMKYGSDASCVRYAVKSFHSWFL